MNMCVVRQWSPFCAALQTTALWVKLKVLNDWYAHRSNIPESFGAELKNTDLLLLFVSERAKPVGYLYVVQYLQRDKLQNQFDEVDIGILSHYLGRDFLRIR